MTRTVSSREADHRGRARTREGTGMNIIEEHRSKVRSGENTFSIEVTALPSSDRSDRLVVSVGASGPHGELVADGQIEVASGAAAALGSVLSETLRHHAARR